MAPENFSPNAPDGAYYDSVRTSTIYFSCMGNADNESIKFNPGIIGKSGEYTAAD